MSVLAWVIVGGVLMRVTALVGSNLGHRLELLQGLSEGQWRPGPMEETR